MSANPEIQFAQSHEWVHLQGDEALIGISTFAQESLGDITYVDLPSVGTALKQGQEMGSIESVKAASEIYSPVTGEVVAVNEALENTPELVNSSPFKEGWLIRVKVSAKPENLLSTKEYDDLVASSSH